MLLIIGIFARITIFMRRIQPLYGMASWMC